MKKQDIEVHQDPLFRKVFCSNTYNFVIHKTRQSQEEQRSGVMPRCTCRSKLCGSVSLGLLKPIVLCSDTKLHSWKMKSANLHLSLENNGMHFNRSSNIHMESIDSSSPFPPFLFVVNISNDKLSSCAEEQTALCGSHFFWDL